MNLFLKIFVCVAACHLLTACGAKKPATTPQKTKMQVLKKVGEAPDQTDIFAIPLDTSAEEEEEEIRMLESLEKKKAAPEAPAKK